MEGEKLRITHDGWEIIRYEENTPIRKQDTLAVELPLTIQLNGHEFATMVCSPSDLADLVCGFLASEGIIYTLDELQELSIDIERGFAYVTLNRTIDPKKYDQSKRFIGSCCGKSRQFYFKSDVRTAKTIRHALTITPSACYHLMNEMQAMSNIFHQTGNMHNAALCTVDKVLFMRHDIGRHNALDKIYGKILSSRLSVRDKVIVFSGRISSEVLLKVSKIGVSILLSKSAPTDLAIKLANDLGITVTGFIRGEKMNVYSHPERIVND